MNTKPFFSSENQTWKTPTKLYEKLDKEFNFDFDPCPNNAKFDGLKISWKSCNFVNPPHKTQNLWIKKAINEADKGNKSVMLLPARTDSKIFHDFIFPLSDEIRFIKGRLHYNDAKNSALFPSMIVIFWCNNKNNKLKIIRSYDWRL